MVPQRRMVPQHRMFVARLALYSVLAAVVAVVLFARPHKAGDGDTEPLHTVHARTAAGEPLMLKLNERDTVRTWSVILRARCHGGGTDAIRWDPGDGAEPVTMTYSDRGTLDAVEVHSEGNWTVRAVLHADMSRARTRGTFHYRKKFADGRVCTSGPVGFSVRPT